MFRQSVFSASYSDLNLPRPSSAARKLADLFLGILEECLSRRQVSPCLSRPLPSVSIWRTVSTLTSLEEPRFSCSFCLMWSSSEFWLSLSLDCTLRLRVLLLMPQAEVKGRFSSVSLLLASSKSCLERGVANSCTRLSVVASNLATSALLFTQFSSYFCFILAMAASSSLFLLVRKQRLFLVSLLSLWVSLRRRLRSAISLSFWMIFSNSLRDSWRKMASSFSRVSMRSRCACSLCAFLIDCRFTISISSLTFFTCTRQAARNSASWVWMMACTLASTLSTYCISSEWLSRIRSSLVFLLVSTLLLRRLATMKEGVSSGEGSSALEEDLRMSAVRKGVDSSFMTRINLSEDGKCNGEWILKINTESMIHCIQFLIMIKGRTDSLAERVAEVFSTSQAVSLPIDRQADESVTLYSEDYQSLLPNRWLRTQAVDILIKLLLQREREEMSKIHASKSEFGSAASRLLVRTMDAFVVTLIMTDQEDYILESLEPLQLFSPATKYLLIPLNTEYCSGNHWLLGLLIREDHDYTLLVFDSGPGSSIGLDLCKRLQLLHRVLTKSEMQITLVLAENIPFQSNGFDCGIYTVGYAEYILKEIVNGLEENSSSLSFDSFNSKYKYLLANSTHSRERYREMLEQQILKAAATG